MMATHWARRKELPKVVDSIIGQVDDLFLYLNDYTVEQFLELRKELPSNVVLMLGRQEAGNITDVGKFYMSCQLYGWQFTLDDDLLYPSNYVQTMIAKAEHYGRSAVICVHGRTFNQLPVDSYYKNSRTYNYKLPLEEDTIVHVGGTGTCCFHSDLLFFSTADFFTDKMADIWFAIKCVDKDVPIIAVQREQGWLKDAKNTDTADIYNEFQGEDGVQTELVNLVRWKVPL